jgi:isopentenyl phosphate kinase
MMSAEDLPGRSAAKEGKGSPSIKSPPASQDNLPCYNSSMSNDIIFLKLGGSLITNKGHAHTARTAVIRRLAGEIAEARKVLPGTPLLLGHGSGSFGHMEAKKYGTAAGVKTPEEWRGFAAVCSAADELNRMIMDALASAGAPAVRIAPSSCAVLENGKIVELSIAPVKAALEAGVVPVVYGDAVLDRKRGGGIASTEMVFAYLARSLRPRRILLAGTERGIFKDFPERQKLISQIRTGEWEQARRQVGGSAQIDVTGGMLTKVQDMLALVSQQKEITAFIFSGETEGNVQRALLDENVEGTRLVA